MRNNTFLFWVLLLVDGVFGSDEVISVSVMEGDSVTLRIDLTEIQEDSKIIWNYGKENIAKIIDGNPSFPNSDEKFRERLKLDEQTGSLTITNIRSEHAGDYSVDVKTTIAKSTTLFKVTVHGVFSDENDGVKTMSEKTGTDVLLHTHVTEIEKDDPIEWTFGPQNISIAKTDGKRKIISYNYNDERFKRLVLHIDSGDLTIKNANSEHSGLYQLKIMNNTFTIQKRFSLTVSDSGSSAAVSGICGVSFGLLVWAVAVLLLQEV